MEGIKFKMVVENLSNPAQSRFTVHTLLPFKPVNWYFSFKYNYKTKATSMYEFVKDNPDQLFGFFNISVDGDKVTSYSDDQLYSIDGTFNTYSCKSGNNSIYITSNTSDHDQISNYSDYEGVYSKKGEYQRALSKDEKKSLIPIIEGKKYVDPELLAGLKPEIFE